MARLPRSLRLCALVSALWAGSAAAWTGALPAPLDREARLVERYWRWLTAETGAPAHLPPPRVTVEPLPATARMAFFFPTPAAPGREMRIAVSPRSIARAGGGEALEVLGELAHELAHYVLLMDENGWAARQAVFVNRRHHHCDPEFQRLTLHMARLAIEVYHARDAERAIRHMVAQACWRDGHAAHTAQRRQ